jgi:acyl dehydratase
MIDARHQGSSLSSFEVRVDRIRLQAFARATGQTDPLYCDAQAAQASGYPDLPVPPTYFFCLEMEAPQPMEIYEHLGVDYALVLHGEQHFRYHRLACAGERLRFLPRISELYARKAGALEFIVRDTRVESMDGQPVVDLRSVLVVNHARAQGLSTPPLQADLPAGVGQHRQALNGSGPCLPTLVTPAITRDMLARYAVASGDDNPLHIDQAYARRAGHPDVFAHGMLSAAYMARQLTDRFDQADIRFLKFRFVAITHLGDAVHCQARVHDTPQSDANASAGHSRRLHGLQLALQAHNQHQSLKVMGEVRVDNLRP